MNQLLTETIIKKVRKVMLEESLVEVEASGRHIHLNRAAIDTLFGEGYQLTPAKELSQPGQFACKERITVQGPKGKFENVVILGPERKESQVEVSLTDSRTLGVNVPIRESGDIAGTPAITLINGDKSIALNQGLIVAKRHIHVSTEDAEKLQVENREIVQVKIVGARPLIFDDVVIRINENYRTFMHIDFDEANACGYQKGALGKIIKKTASDSLSSTKKREAPARAAEFEQAIGETASLDKKVISENDLQKVFLKKVTSIRIPASSIITPLARDYIRMHKLQILRSEENEA